MKPALALAALLALSACSGEKAAAPHPGKALSCEASETGAVTATAAWLREQQDQSAMSAAYFSLCNGSMTPAILTGVSTPAAGMAEIHQSSRDENNIVSMAPAGDITLAPGERVLFEPGGKHVMLMALAAPIARGDHAALTLHFAIGASIVIDAVAKSNVEAATVDHEGR